MAIPNRILELIERFDYNLDSYKKGIYNETQVRLEYINPLMEELGWDVTNQKGYSEAYKEVIHEDAVKVGGVTKAPDYCFRVGGTRKFFLEAKKPSVNIKDDIHPAYQLRRYAWSAKLPLSILTDFEEFAVYDCRVKPVKTDKASNARVMYLKFSDYKDKWDEINGIFSREAILKGSFDKYVESKKKKKGTAEVDTAFLEEIERWRELLARNIALRNPSLSQREVNFSVQRTIDRIIFLRICEDRGIENYGRLMALQNGDRVYKRLFQLFREADARYNSGLFYFHPEKGRSTDLDDLTPDLNLDDKVIKDILKNLYYPDSPYEFSVLPANILGQVYEQFLGKVIRLTPGHHAIIELKPEVRKAGGVYYTPTYIVDYIVKETVGQLVEGKKPGPRGGVSKLRILDPACGSGSFLLGAYQFLLNWHRDQYVKDDPEKWAKGKSPCLFLKSGDDWRLTTDERKRILLNNIYGVDKDDQAVEVTKLSLLLKVLEGEDDETIQKQFLLFQKRALPDLGSNIKCGNSLIGSDFYDGQLNLFDDEEMYRINAFDWEKEFPDIMKTSGFDAVIGNPPYVRSISLKQSSPHEWEHYRSRYKSSSSREWDIYLIFVEKGMTLLKTDGRLSYILPNKFINSKVGESLRSILSEGKFLEKLIHFEAFQIFQGATTYTCLLFLNKSGKEKAFISRYKGKVEKTEQRCLLPEEAQNLWSQSEISHKNLGKAPWEFTSNLISKLNKWPGLATFGKVFQGTGTRADKVYILQYLGEEEGMLRVYSTQLEESFLIEPTFLKPALRGRSIGRYSADNNLRLIVPYGITNEKAKLISEDVLAKGAPKTFEYLKRCKRRLDEREKGRFKGDGWYQYGRPQNLHRFDVTEKIVFPDVANRGICLLDENGLWLLDTAYGISKLRGVELDLRYIIGILNSPILTYFLKEKGTVLRGGYFRMKTAYLNPFPIRAIDFENSVDKANHDKLVEMTDQIQSLNKKLLETKSPQSRTVLQRQIEATDRQIDKLVYQLYELTDEEIQIVEAASG